jgi:hypothetical protein
LRKLLVLAQTDVADVFERLEHFGKPIPTRVRARNASRWQRITILRGAARLVFTERELHTVPGDAEALFGKKVLSANPAPYHFSGYLDGALEVSVPDIRVRVRSHERPLDLTNPVELAIAAQANDATLEELQHAANYGIRRGGAVPFSRLTGPFITWLAAQGIDDAHILEKLHEVDVFALRLELGIPVSIDYERTYGSRRLFREWLEQALPAL